MNNNMITFQTSAKHLQKFYANALYIIDDFILTFKMSAHSFSLYHIFEQYIRSNEKNQFECLINLFISVVYFTVN